MGYEFLKIIRFVCHDGKDRRFAISAQSGMGRQTGTNHKKTTGFSGGYCKMD
jgi:hypothetical protein